MAASPACFTFQSIASLFIVIYSFSLCTVDVSMKSSAFCGNRALSLNFALCLRVSSFFCLLIIIFPNAGNLMDRVLLGYFVPIIWHVSTTTVPHRYGGLLAPQSAEYEFGRCNHLFEIISSNICIYPTLFCEIIAVLYLLLYLFFVLYCCQASLRYSYIEYLRYILQLGACSFYLLFG